MINIADIEAAALRLEGVSVRTPLLRNDELDRAAGGIVLVKPECLQVTGSFKIRGAYNFLCQLTAGAGESRRRCVVVGQPRPGGRGGGRPARHGNGDRHAGGRAEGEAQEYAQARR